jgi:CubicO group peptidase (beta-lactamase class C family)
MKKLLVAIFVLNIPLLLFAEKDAVVQGRLFATNLLAEAKLPGLSIAVYTGDTIIWSEGFGFADLKGKMPITPLTRFRIGSVTKLLTAAAAAKLYEEGRLDLDAPVQEYIHSFPLKEKPITTRQLLGHLSGIRHYGRSEYFNRHNYNSITEALSIFQNDSLNFPPGTKYGYSSYGYVLASAVIETASGKDFLRYLKEDIIEPLSLSSISPDYNDTTDKSQAKPYSLDSLGNWVEGPSINNSDRWAAGGWLSTAEDLVRFASLLFKDGYLKEQTRELLVTTQKTAQGTETNVGLGWRIGKDSLGNQYFHHGGESIGGRAFILVYPSSKVVVALLANLTFAQFGEKEALQLAEKFSK